MNAVGNTNAQSEVIAVLVGDIEADAPSRRLELLVRYRDGSMQIESWDGEEDIEAAQVETGCFRRGTPIIDPISREVIGYELEEIPYELC